MLKCTKMLLGTGTKCDNSLSKTILFRLHGTTNALFEATPLLLNQSSMTSVIAVLSPTLKVSEPLRLVYT